ncbi:hypothetical protein EG328_005097 [Venturia inaequalis]|uniref:MFS general substrate transporter n=1 Tax=Venturia inaequalis TaxID=5025 RepID=A0A8H3Z645_VENIN|nr:hypothetical protein EG328_005097 [Venturia inaequalis]KAE9986799.1 hypothetical protein EG327_004168 [Venturia inaequalis]RDI85924.1 hypothetical protein Vi05172_g4085 [Venturia inaequalis]
MAWGVLEDKRTPRPAGTVLLDDAIQNATDKPGPSHLKRDAKNKHIILQPQPSNSPNDPLNWEFKTKALIIFTLITTMTAVGGIVGMLGTAGRILATQYHVDYPTFVKTLGPPAIAANAIALFVSSSMSAVYGRRFQIFVGVMVIWINMLAGYFANSLGYYRSLGIVNGIFGAPLELLIAPIITDMIYVHERGRLMALTAVIGVVGGDASHVIAGNIISRLGVKYLYIISFGVLVPFLLAIFFFVRETTFERKRIAEPTVIAGEGSYEVTPETKAKVNHPAFNTGGDGNKAQDVLTKEDSSFKSPNTGGSSISIKSNESALDVKHTTRQNLALWRGRLTDRSLIKAFFQPFPLMIFPSVLFSTVVNGAFITWTMTSGIITHQVLLYPPYNLKPDTLAYIGLPGSVVGLISSIVAGMASDWLIKFMARRNNGVYEPEYRLVMMIPAVLFSTIGFLTLGPLYARHAPVAQLVVANLLFYLGGPFASSACVTYLFDTMQYASTEAFVATSLFKHLFMFLATTYVPAWFAKVGPVQGYQTLAILNLAFASLAIPMYVFGKKARGMVARNAFLRKASRVE